MEDLQKFTSEKKVYYTITGKTDGFGSQYQAIMSGIAYCYYNNYEYIHTPIIKMEHLLDTEVDKINKFIGIESDNSISEKILEEQKEIILNKNYNNNDTIIERFSSDVHNSKTPSIYYTEPVINKIIDFYYSTSKPTIDIDIAIHIRRGDVDIDKHPDRYTSNKEYINIIK